MELTEFLLARITEDEAEVGPDYIEKHRDEGAGPNGIGWAEVGAISEVLMSSQRRALRECEAKRRIVEACGIVDNLQDEYAVGLRDDTLAALASVYADHPDYREEWKP